MSVLGRDIDFVNLRSETYVESTRIPTMVCTYLIGLSAHYTYICEYFLLLIDILQPDYHLQKSGTAEQDAYRRDLTINR
jgi:tRNA nucleotidyltransferase/poly(A) polymerase